MSGVAADLRYAARVLIKSPGFMAVAILALALGIGASTAIFSIINSVILSPLPYPDPDRIVMVWATKPAENREQLLVSDADYVEWVDQNRVFEGMAAVQYSSNLGSSFTTGREPEYVVTGQVSPGFFSLMGIAPVRGRGFVAEEGVPGGPGAVILTEALWQSRLGGSEDAIGASVRLDGTSYTVVGVTPSTIRRIVDSDVYVPIQVNPARPQRRFGVVARLLPGVTLEQAQSEMDVIAARLAEEYPARNEGYGARVVRLSGMASSLVGPALLILLGAVMLLLLIGCSNVANLLLARALGRRKEIALRAALGATRLQIVRQLLAESLLLGLAGGTIGLGIAALSLRFLRYVPTDLVPGMSSIDVDVRVLGFTLGLSLVTVLVFGLWPALRVSKTSEGEALKEGGTRGVLAGGGQRSQSMLLAAEVSLALMLAVGAGLMLRSFAELLAVDPGVRTENILVGRLYLRAEEYQDVEGRRLFGERLLERLRALPGAVSASVNAGDPPFELSWVGLKPRSQFMVVGRPPPAPGHEPTAYVRRVSRDFFRMLDISLIQGRLFTDYDTHEAPNVTVVSQTFVRQHFPGEDPTGRRVFSGGQEREIVGVVEDVKLYGLDEPFEPTMYLPYAQAPGPFVTIMVGTSSDPGAFSETVRKAVLAVDAEQAMAEPTTMAERYAQVMLPRRLSTTLFGVFAFLALALAMVGVLALTSQLVNQRTQEFGLRMALGAGRGDLYRLVVGRGVRTAAIGVVVGLVGSFALTRLMSGLLFGVNATDPLIFATVPLMMIGVTALASFAPAYRAAHVDPISALRHE